MDRSPTDISTVVVVAGLAPLKDDEGGGRLVDTVVELVNGVEEYCTYSVGGFRTPVSRDCVSYEVLLREYVCCPETSCGSGVVVELEPTRLLEFSSIVPITLDGKTRPTIRTLLIYHQTIHILLLLSVFVKKIKLASCVILFEVDFIKSLSKKNLKLHVNLFRTLKYLLQL